MLGEPPQINQRQEGGQTLRKDPHPSVTFFRFSRVSGSSMSDQLICCCNIKGSKPSDLEEGYQSLDVVFEVPQIKAVKAAAEKLDQFLQQNLGKVWSHLQVTFRPGTAGGQECSGSAR